MRQALVLEPRPLESDCFGELGIGFQLSMANLSNNSVRSILRRLREIPTPARGSSGLSPRGLEMRFWGRITAVGTGATLHSWKRVRFDDAESDKFGDWPVTAAGAENAIAIGGTPKIGDLVQLELIGQVNGEPRFAFPAMAGLVYAKVTGMKDSDGHDWTAPSVPHPLPTYAEANPAQDSRGITIDTGATVYVGLNDKEDAPNGLATAVDQIIGYWRNDGYDVVTDASVVLSGYAIHGKGCWMDWVRFRSVS